MVEGVIVTFVEITRIVEAKAQQRTLVEGLHHRVRNVLSVVNAIARQTPGGMGACRANGRVCIAREVHPR
jgi:two-component sensor histidine kinase